MIIFDDARLKIQFIDPTGSDREAHTNVGEFVPGEIRRVAERLARTLIANGEFRETEEEPNGKEVRPLFFARKEAEGKKAAAERMARDFPEAETQAER